jgi:hypothetical protein
MDISPALKRRECWFPKDTESRRDGSAQIFVPGREWSASLISR